MSSGGSTTGDIPSEEQSYESSPQPVSLSSATQSHGHILSQPHTELVKPMQKNVRPIAPAPSGIVKPVGGGQGSSVCGHGSAVGGHGSVIGGHSSAIGGHSAAIAGLAPGILTQAFRVSQKGSTDSSHMSGLGSSLMVGTHPVSVTLPQTGGIVLNPSSIASTQPVAPSVISPSLPINIMRGPAIQNNPTFPSHLPRGAVAASALSLAKTGPTMAAGSAILRPAQPATVQVPISTGQGLQTFVQANRPLISTIKPVTPPVVRSTSPAIGISMPTKHVEHRPSYHQYPGSVTPSSNSAIQITLRNPTSTMDNTSKQITGQIPNKSVQLSQSQQAVVAPSKIIVSQSSTNPIMPSSLVNTAKAKITAQRQTAVPTLLPTSVTDVSRPESISQQIGHASSMFFPNQHTVPHTTDSRLDRSNISNINMHVPYQEPVYNMSMYNHSIPNYHTLMYQPQTNVRQAGINFLFRPQLEQSVSATNPVSNLSATLQAHPMTMANTASVRYNPIMIEHTGRHSSIPIPSYSSSLTTSIENKTGSFLGATLSESSMSNLASVATVASSLYASASGNQQQPISSSTPNPSASPRPTILRKRTSENSVASVAKKPLALIPESHSPRPESSNQPQSNTSSPKTPAGENSQSSTDTALSSNDAVTPTQNTAPEMRVKQEPPDILENGLAVLTSVMTFNATSNLSCNSVEASPRKKPRKQLLHANEELKDDTSSDEEIENLTEIKKERIPQIEEKTEYIDDEGIRWTTDRCKPNVSLLNFYNLTWKARNNHFQKATDVKPKEERRPTVNELANQKGIIQKSSGWKLYHMAAQLEDLVDLEKELCDRVSKYQQIFEPKFATGKIEDDYNKPYEVAQANIQRCQLLVDQLLEAKSSMLKVLDHKPKIQEIVNKHMSKRPIKKKERP